MQREVYLAARKPQVATLTCRSTTHSQSHLVRFPSSRVLLMLLGKLRERHVIIRVRNTSEGTTKAARGMSVDSSADIGILDFGSNTYAEPLATS